MKIASLSDVSGRSNTDGSHHRGANDRWRGKLSFRSSPPTSTAAHDVDPSTGFKSKVDGSHSATRRTISENVTASTDRRIRSAVSMKTASSSTKSAAIAVQAHTAWQSYDPGTGSPQKETAESWEPPSRWRLESFRSLMDTQRTLRFQLADEERALQALDRLKDRKFRSRELDQRKKRHRRKSELQSRNESGLISAAETAAITTTESQSVQGSKFDSVVSGDVIETDILESEYMQDRGSVGTAVRTNSTRRKHREERKSLIERLDRQREQVFTLEAKIARLDDQWERLLDLLEDILAAAPDLRSRIDDRVVFEEDLASVLDDDYDDESDVPSLVARLFDKRGDVGIYSDRLRNLDLWRMEDTDQREFIKEKGVKLSVSDAQFELDYQRQREEIMRELEAAESQARVLERQCNEEGYNTVPKLRASLSSAAASQFGNMEPEMAPTSIQVLRGTVKEPHLSVRSSDGCSIGGGSIADWLREVPNIGSLEDPNIQAFEAAVNTQADNVRHVGQVQSLLNSMQSFQPTRWTAEGMSTRHDLLYFASSTETQLQARRRSL